MKPALLLIDLQSDFLASANLHPPASLLVSRAAKLLQGCRARQIPVIHIWMTVNKDNDRRLPHWRKMDRWMCVAGTAGHETPKALRPTPGETVIHKTGFNPFVSGELEKILRSLGCDTVVLAGLHLHACVRATAMESLERNFQVFVAEDAVASNDPIHAAATRRWLAERCVEFESTGALLNRCNSAKFQFAKSEKQNSNSFQARKWVHRSPCCTDEILFEVHNAGAAEIDDAVSAAQSAWAQWRKTSMALRQKILHDLAHRLEEGAKELARQMAIEIGKPIRHAEEEIHRAAANLRDVACRAAILTVPKRESAGLVRHEPLGVVGIISAWNNPVAIPLGKIGPALVYGNVVVWKPAPVAAKISETLLNLLRESGAAADLVKLVQGDHTTAQLVAANENVNAVTLTGSLAAGHAIQEICARRVVPLQAELSGNNAAIVWDDADFADAASQIAWGAFGFAGQRCTANRRVIIHAPHFENFLRELEAATARLPWSDPLKTETEIGPVINIAKRDELLSLIAAAETDRNVHRIIRPQSNRADEPRTKIGAYAQPVIVCCDASEHILVQEETMSPLLVVQRADDFDHALALCNGVRHGLSAALFSDSTELREKFLGEARAGILKFNSSTAGVDVTLPFGGWKSSGVGPPEHGAGDFLFYTRMQAVYGLENCDELG